MAAVDSDVPMSAALHADAFVWDQHATVPLRPSEDVIEALGIYQDAGVDVVSVMVGSDLLSTVDTLQLLATLRRGLRKRSDRYVLVSRLADMDEAKRSGRLAVTFNLEGTEPLDGEIALLAAFCDLGVRTVLIAYNRNNRAGGGCHDGPDAGLTDYGRTLVREMNELGVLVDASHCSVRTTLDLCDVSAAPVIFSHCVPASVYAHERNVSDDQMRACAATGGVIGINGVGLLLGEPEPTADALVRAVDYAVGVVGVEHVGLGLDYLVNQAWLTAYMAERPDIFPNAAGYTDAPIRFLSPSELPEVTALLLRRGYAESAVRGILGGNFLRVAREVWP